MKTDGHLIRRRRIGLGYGVNSFAALAGISGAALSRIENELRSPRPETLKKIANALGCPIDEVITEVDGTDPEVQSGSAAAHNEAAGVQPAASVEQSAPTCQ